MAEGIKGGAFAAGLYCLVQRGILEILISEIVQLFASLCATNLHDTAYHEKANRDALSPRLQGGVGRLFQHYENLGERAWR